MLVHFLTDDTYVKSGFRASFQYIPIESNCLDWLNMTALLLKSPDYPTINCSWVITAPTIDSTITFHFDTFEVKCCQFHIFLLIYLHKLFKIFLSLGI